MNNFRLGHFKWPAVLFNTEFREFPADTISRFHDYDQGLVLSLLYCLEIGRENRPN